MRFIVRLKAAQSSEYRADIDGLRAIAVLSVVGFHAHVAGSGGGYVGVDVFFVISGFLITGILQRSLASGTFSFWTFYDRRIRRIFPALFAVLLVVTCVGLMVFQQWELRDYGRSLLAVTEFVSNFYFRSTTHDLSGYFKQTAEQQWLLHTWSLSLEEQFYLFFPILLLCLHRFARRYTAAILIGLLIASFALSARGVFHSPIATFYLLPARAWELLLGSVVALRVLPEVTDARLRGGLAAVGLCVVAYAVAFYTHATRFPGPAALLPCVGAALLLYAGQDGESWIGRALGCGPLAFVGAISYSLYLWHWPVLLGMQYFYTSSLLTPLQIVFAVVLSFALAILSFEFVEVPFRRRSTRTRRTVWVGVIASAAVAAIAFQISAGNGFPRRFSGASASLIAKNGGLQAAKLEACGNYHPSPKQYGDATFCEFGGASPKLLVWGDSHGEQMYPLLERMRVAGELHDASTVYAIAEGCILAADVQLADADYRCDAYMRYALMRAAKPDVDTVLIVFSPWWVVEPSGRTCLARDGSCSKPMSGAEAWQVFLHEMSLHIRDLEKMGKRVVLTVPFPMYRESIPALQTRNITLARLRIAPQRAVEALPRTVTDDVKRLAAESGAAMYDPRTALCPGDECVYQEGNVSLYADDSHLTVDRLEVLRAGLRDVLGKP